MSDKLYKVGIYIRLSLENTAYRGEDSMSIENQQAMLSKFISVMPGWVETRTYIDNGASGGNFNRKGFQDMMSDVRSGIINLVLVQDLSRFGRNYLEAGRYLEDELPSLGCRFVALSDGIDTENGENDIMPFLNAMNDCYLKNLSDRIKVVLTAKAKNGQKVTGTAPYGYDRNPVDHTRLIVDEYAAGVVRKIYELRTVGTGYAKIAGTLNNENILPPKLYRQAKMNREFPAEGIKLWQAATVKVILHDEQYLGHTISLKTKSLSHRDTRMVNRRKSEWIRVEDTHTPIIDTQVWEIVQEINQRAKEKSLTAREPRQSLFSKMLVCADCKTNMAVNIDSQPRKNGNVVSYASYFCRKFTHTGGSSCSRHTIYEISLKKILLDEIKRQAKMIELNEDRMLCRLQDKLIGGSKAEQAGRAVEQRALKQQLHLMETQTEQLYEDKVSGLITSERFSELVSATEIKRSEIEKRIALLEQSAENAKSKLSDIQKWMRLIQEKSTLKDVDRDLLETLIDKIEIGERRVENGVKSQDIRIFYKFVGAV